jgi:hypothetical protein
VHQQPNPAPLCLSINRAKASHVPVSSGLIVYSLIGRTLARGLLQRDDELRCGRTKLVAPAKTAGLGSSALTF